MIKQKQYLDIERCKKNTVEAMEVKAQKMINAMLRSQDLEKAEL